jgi:3-deoxy-D-manno-octulosonate 8-phosphate phosphatase (KDO 8-P phosphatase)
VFLPTCPADACDEVKAISKYISSKNGGKGCVRDVIEKVLKLNNDWE